MRRFDVVCVGDLNCDLILTGLARPPAAGGEVLAERYRLTLGGSTAISAAVLASLGARVGFVAMMGRDHFGDLLRALLEAYTVDTRAVRSSTDVQTGLSVSLVQGGDRALVTVLGTIAGLRGGDIQWDYIKQAGHLHVGSFYLQSGLRPSMAAILAEARDAGLTTSLDTGWDPAEAWSWTEVAALLPYVDVFLPNETEALHLTGAPDIEPALASLLEAGARAVAVKRGVEGAVAGRGSERWASPSYAVKVLDTTGAGDSFNAGFIHRWLAGDDLDACLAFGNACGALATARIGGADGAPTETAVREFMHSSARS